MLLFSPRLSRPKSSVVMDAIAATVVFLLFISLSFVGTTAETKPPKLIELGSSINPRTHPNRWVSASGLFTFGFYEQGSGYAVGIWLVNDMNSKTVVWTANRDDPLVTSNAMLQLTVNGMLLQTEQGQEKLIANATASSASMLDSGNFVLYNKNLIIIWQSFDYPTDTMLGGQSLPSGGQLFSSSSDANGSTGGFRLKMQHDGNLVLYPVNTTDTAGDAYWASDTLDDKSCNWSLSLNETGSLLIMKNSTVILEDLFDGNSTSDKIINEGKPTIYRATLDPSGFFKLFVHVENDDGGVNTMLANSWPDGKDVSILKGFSGFNSYCEFVDGQAYCNCLPGFDFINRDQERLGCKRNISEAECRGEKDDATFYHMVPMENIVWGGLPFFEAKMSREECSSSCLADCKCEAALYQEDHCMKQNPPLKYVRMIRHMEPNSTAFLKVGNNSLKNWKLNDVPEPDQPPPIKSTSNKAMVQIILVTSGFTLLLCSTIAISSHLIYKIRDLRYKRLLELGDLGLNEEVALRRFSYNELKRATNNFKEELGKGSFGAVYKGALYKGRRLIAVKRLGKLVEDGEREFQAEMRAIGKTHHRNLVRLLGYCAEGSKRLLVYEYMSSGSLGKLIFGVRRPDWDERVTIALDIARGILYLHEECEVPIIHCDIKPQNILMDDFCTAKISDFGLAKLLMPDQTRTFTAVRGTRGYMAPEWQKNTPISVKADVYSYGIVLLEIVCCRRNLEVNVLEPEKTVLSSWAYQCFVARELNKLVLWDDVDKNVLENMVKVACWCIQDEPFLRPTMKSVVLMLEGITDIAIPPCPTSNSM